MNPDDNQPTPPVTPTEDNQVPTWAQTLIDQNTDLSNRLSAFEETQTPAPVEPIAPVDDTTWTPKSWEDVASRIDETAGEKAQTILDAREAAAKASDDQQQNAAKEIDTYLDGQVVELTKAKSLPAVTNENDPNDPGKLAQRELYGFALSLGTADLKSSYNTLDALHKAGKQFDFVKMELVDKSHSSDGASSPVGSSGGGTTSNSIRPDYKTLHNTSLDALAHRFTENA